MRCVGALHRAYAQGTISVTTTDDEYDSGILCSLREAVESANLDSDFGGCLRVGPIADPLNPTPPYTIVLAGGTYELSIAGRLQDDNATGDLDLRADMIITGVDPASTTIQAGPSAGGGIEDTGTDAATTTMLENVTLSENMTGPHPGNGGGYHLTAAGIITIAHSNIMSNVAVEGGGVWNSGVGEMSITQTVIHDKEANGEGENQGGGVFNVGGPLDISNSTISGNHAQSAGGGVMAIGGEATRLINVTVYTNHAENGANGIQTRNDASVMLANSIVAHAMAEDEMANGPDCAGDINIAEGTPNLDRDGSCGASITGDPLLSMLQDNGGGTLTHALLSGSPAFNAGDNEICAAAPVNNVDQRGVTRPLLGQCDLGAYEDAIEFLRQLLLPYLMRD